ncbi:GNAT family N-acetyltransferase [Frateuria defendens]|uniref:GNAT family N-acetyltransferase n=1 Tax=Frateuria defendens TaxID=2219559 RepID=UPI00066FB522|nr:GNAT family N-acetyltransferase [Frateuria defendens]
MSTTTLSFRFAARADIDLLVDMVRRFHAEDRLAFDETRLRRGLGALLADPSQGEVLLWLDAGEAVAGYAVLTWGFSLEQDGRFLLLDELYLEPATRGRGWGRQALALLERRAEQLGATRLRLEVTHHNAHAKALYLQAGYADERRDLLARTLPAAACQ